MAKVEESVRTYISGHCSNGNHEGTKNLSIGGALFPSCKFIYNFRYLTITCTCFCHELFNMVRVPEPAASTDPIPSMQLGGTSVSGDVGPSMQASMPVGRDVTAVTDQEFWRKVLEHEDLTLQVFRFVSWHVFGVKGERSATDNLDRSRRARGSLDINVEAICKLRLEGYIPQDLTPSNIALLIDPLNPPSDGAIHAVLTRWKNAGYCFVGEKPVTMNGFTELVSKSGITGAKRVSARDREARAKGFF